MRRKKNFWQALQDWRPLLYILASYFLISVFGDFIRRDLGLPTFPYLYFNLESFLFAGNLPTLMMQGFHKPWLDVLCVIYYSTFLILPLTAMFYIYFKDRRLFLRMRSSLLILSAIGFFFYLFFPGYPPWMVSEQRMLMINNPWQTTEFGRMFTRMITGLHANTVAPFPSLHIGFSLLISYFIFRLERIKGVFLYPLLMAFVILYTGDHYVVDIIGGVVAAYLSIRLDPFGIIKEKESKKLVA